MANAAQLNRRHCQRISVNFYYRRSFSSKLYTISTTIIIRSSPPSINWWRPMEANLVYRERYANRVFYRAGIDRE